MTCLSLYRDIGKKIIDPTGKAIESIAQRKIKMNKPVVEVLKDNPLILLDAIYYATRFDFDLDDDIKSSAEKFANPLLESTNPGRVNSALMQLFSRPNASKNFALLFQLNIFQQIFPMLVNAYDDILKYMQTVEDSIEIPSLDRVYDQFLLFMKEEDKTKALAEHPLIKACFAPKVSQNRYLLHAKNEKPKDLGMPAQAHNAPVNR